MKRILYCTLIVLLLTGLLAQNSAMAATMTVSGVTVSSYTSDVTPGVIRYVSQRLSTASSYGWGKYSNNTTATYGPENNCTMACQSMAFSYLGINATPEQVVKNTPTVFSNTYQFTEAKVSYKTGTAATTSVIDSYLNLFKNDGGLGNYAPVVIHYTNGQSGSSLKQHAVLIIGKDSNGYIALDPWLGNGQNYTQSVRHLNMNSAGNQITGDVPHAGIGCWMDAVQQYSLKVPRTPSTATRYSIPNTVGNVATVGHATVYADMVSDPGAGKCWDYANAIYAKIWSVNFASDFAGSSSKGWNYLRSMSDSERALTAANTQKFISAAPLGATIRIQSCTSSCSAFGNDGLSCGHNGHSLILVAKSSSGFTVLHRDNTAIQETTYTWSGFASTWANWKYFKYIKWPGARDAKWDETSLMGKYMLTETRPGKHDPADASVTLAGYNPGDIVNIVASLTKPGSTTWYKLADGTFVFSGALEKVSYTLDVNFTYNGTEIFPDSSVISFNVKVGSDTYTGYSDWYSPDFYPFGLTSGTTYEVSQIKPQPGYVIESYGGSLSGSISDDTVVWINLKACTHDNPYITKEREASCTEPGLLKYTCSCGEVWYSSDSLPPTGHAVVNDPAVAATCTTTGKTAGSHCSVCGTVITAQTTVPVLPHTPVTDAAVPATCETAGKTAGSHCSVCGKVLTVQTTIPATGHTVVNDSAVAATCTTEGKTAGSHCSVCGKVLTAQQVIPAKGHTPVTDAAVEATCTEGGLTEGSHCSDCGEILVAQSAMPPKGHTIVTDPAVAATCATAGKTEGSHCSVCGTVITAQQVIPAKGHTPVTDAAVEATCTEGGLTEGSHCSDCSEILVAQNTTPPKGHTIVTDPAVAATCTTAGKTAGSHCSVCGTVLTAQSETPPTGHTPGEWVVETEPTATSEGLKVQKCTICGVTLQSETIPPLQPDIDDGTVAPTAGTVRGKAGETIEVKVYINSEKAALAYVRVHFDSSVLEFVSASGGSVQPQGNDGTFVFGSGFSAFKSETGTIQLKIKDGAQQGNYPVTTAVLEAYDADGEEVIAKAAADKVQVSNKLPGDVDDNGKVNGRDALLLLQYTAGWNVNINTINADVDANGKVNGRDALLLLQYTAGWSITLK